MAREPRTSRDTGGLPHSSGAANEASSGRGRLADALDGAAFLVLLVIVAMRPLLSETYDSALHGVSEAAGDAASLTPATSAAFDVAIWLASVVTAVSAVLKRRTWRWTGLEIGWAIMVAAAAVSSWAASNKRLAVNASCDWLTAVVLAITLANLVRDRRRVVLVLAVVTASGLASAVKCGTQIAWEFDDTYAAYLAHKEEFWARQGVALTDPTVELFERRMQAREATGFLPYSNAQGAGLSLATFAGIALALAAGRRSVVRVLCAVLAALIMVVLPTTGSRGAVAAAVVGLVLLTIGALVRPRLGRSWRLVWAGAWAVTLVGAAAVVAWGVTHGRLPGDSLRFRWEYWEITSRIISRHPWTGVGALNFDRAYMMHKPVEYAEEIRDPHNFVLSIVSQWGWPGGLGLLVILAGGSWGALRRWGQYPLPTGETPERRSPGDRGRAGAPATGRPGSIGVKMIVLISASFVVLRLWVLRGWWSSGEGGTAAAFFDLFCYGLAWVLGFTGISWSVGRAGPTPAAGYLPACLAGAAAFLLHNTIEFSLFVPGTLTTFAAVVAVVLAGENVEPSARRIEGSSVVLVVSAIGLAVVIGLVAAPVVQCMSKLGQARNAGMAGSGDPTRLYKAAAEADRLDPTPLTEWAAWLARKPTVESLDQVLDCLREAELRDPLDRRIARFRSQALVRRYQLGGSAGNLLQAVAAAERALHLYPNSPDAHVELAGVLSLVAGNLANNPAAIAAGRNWQAEAAWHYQKALDLDASRPACEIRRWSPQYRLELTNRLEQLQSAPASQLPDAVPTAPATRTGARSLPVFDNRLFLFFTVPHPGELCLRPT